MSDLVMVKVTYNSIIAKGKGSVEVLLYVEYYLCYDLAKWLSHYLFFFSYLDLLHKGGV